MIMINKCYIRKAILSDLKQIYMFEREYIIEHEPNQLSKWDAIRTKTMELLTNQLEKIYVATVNEELVGHVFWSIYLEQPCVYSIYVHKKFRSRGIASELLHYLEKQIVEQGYNKLTLSTLETNPAKYLFEKSDYVVLDIKNGWIEYSKPMK